MTPPARASDTDATPGDGIRACPLCEVNRGPGHDALRDLTTGPASALIGDGLVLDMALEVLAGIALRCASDASAALIEGDTRKAGDHLADAYIAALVIGPLDSPEVQEVTAVLDRVAADWDRRR